MLYLFPVFRFTQIKETCIYTAELARAERFYSEVLGLEKIGQEEGRYVFFRAGSSVLLIFNPEYTATQQDIPSHDGYGRIHFAFEVASPDFESSESELLKKEVEIIHRHTWKNGTRSLYFHDPDGHVLEIVEKGLWEK